MSRGTRREARPKIIICIRARRKLRLVQSSATVQPPRSVCSDENASTEGGNVGVRLASYLNWSGHVCFRVQGVNSEKPFQAEALILSFKTTPWNLNFSSCKECEASHRIHKNTQLNTYLPSWYLSLQEQLAVVKYAALPILLSYLVVWAAVEKRSNTNFTALVCWMYCSIWPPSCKLLKIIFAWRTFLSKKTFVAQRSVFWDIDAWHARLVCWSLRTETRSHLRLRYTDDISSLESHLKPLQQLSELLDQRTMDTSRAAQVHDLSRGPDTSFNTENLSFSLRHVRPEGWS